MIQLTDKTQIQVLVSEFKGKQYLDIRKYYEDAAGDYRPTPKGISIPLELAKEVIKEAEEKLTVI